MVEHFVLRRISGVLTKLLTFLRFVFRVLRNLAIVSENVFKRLRKTVNPSTNCASGLSTVSLTYWKQVWTSFNPLSLCLHIIFIISAFYSRWVLFSLNECGPLPSLSLCSLAEHTLILLPQGPDLSAANHGPPLHHDARQRPGKEAGPLQAHGRGGQARLGRGPAGLRPEEEGGGPAWVSSDVFPFLGGELEMKLLPNTPEQGHALLLLLIQLKLQSLTKPVLFGYLNLSEGIS